MKRDLPAPCKRSAVASVPVEKLDDARRLPKGVNPRFERRCVDGVDQPWAPVLRESMRRALEMGGLLRDPTEAEGKLVAEARAQWRLATPAS